MNRLIIISILCVFSFSNQLFAQKKKTSNKKDLTYQIIFNLPGIPDTVLLLANYYGEHTYLRDTLYPSKKNPYSFILEGNDTLKRGVYILAGQNNVKYMEDLPKFFRRFLWRRVKPTTSPGHWSHSPPSDAAEWRRFS